MTNENWHKVRNIFDDALRQKPEERRRFVSEVCGEDKSLLAEVESLLASHDRAESFMETPAVAKVAEMIEPLTKKLEKGSSFGHYEIAEQIGAGGMGEVYLAHDTKLDRKVALKFLPGAIAQDRERLRRFQQEARATSALNHPNIFTVFEIGEADGRHYIATEFIDGETLGQRIAAGPMKLGETLNIAEQITSALSAAHRAGIVHRDIKPENIMIREDGLVKVLDFGLAKLVEPKNRSVLGLEELTLQQNQTAKGVIMGTVSYMSPEQASGQRVDARTDIFSFGIVLYEMLTGQQPFTGPTANHTIVAILEKEPPPVSQLTKSSQPEIDGIIKKCLAKKPDERYNGANSLLDDLKQLKEELAFQSKLERSSAPDKRADAEKEIIKAATVTDEKSQAQRAIRSHVKEISAAVIKTNAQAPQAVKPEAELERSFATNAGNSTAFLQARTGDANQRTVKTQTNFSQTIKRNKPLAAFVLAALLVGGIGLGYYFFSTGKSALGADGKKSIAVLPLKPINAANRDEVYEIGIADSLIHRLGSMKGFIVRPLSAIRKYADIEQDPIAAGKEQQVDYVLASNYQLAGGKIRITAQLLNVASGQIEETYKSEKDASDVFAMQDAIAGDVGNILSARFSSTSSGVTAKRGTTNEEAYRLYLQGIYLNDKRTAADSRKGVEAFEQAIRLDPNYARAWAGKAHAHRSFSNFGSRATNVHEEHQQSMQAINKALELDQNLSEAYSVLCENKMYYEYDFAGAETACKRAIELKPNSPQAHNIYARFLMGPGRRFDEAITEIKTAIDLDPAAYYHQVIYQIVLTFARRYDEADRQLERIAAINPNGAAGIFWYVGGIERQGNNSEAFERLMRFQTLSKTDEKTRQLYKTAYQTSGWQGVLRERAKWLYEYNLSHYFFSACVNAQIGDKDKAFEYLEKSYQERELWMAYLQVDPRLDSLRDDPRFQDLLRRVGLK